MPELESRTEAAVDQALEQVKDQPGPLLEVLHGVQDRLGYIPHAAVSLIAHALNLSRAEVHGVVSFYHYFRQAPPGRRTIYLCRAEACQSMGGRALEAHGQTTLGIRFHETTADGEVSLEPVYCLGNCALSPAMMIDRQLYGRMTAERFDHLIGKRPRS